MKANTPVYVIKPKYIFKSPFLKYDLQNPTNRQAQNQELTQYFNYGFNQDTMNIYAKLVNRTLKVLDHKRNLQYFDEPSQLMRLNDQIPMDLGGFCKFYDPQVFKNDFIKNDQQLFKNFLFNTFKATYINGKQYPMLEFVKSMYRKKPSNGENQQNQNQDDDNPLPSMIQQISKNLQKKYQQTMKKLIQQKNQPKQTASGNLPFKKGGKFQKKTKITIQVKQKQEEKKKQKVKVKKEKQSSSSDSQSSSDSSSSDSSSSSQSEGQRRRNRDRKHRDSKRNKERSRKRSRSRQKKSSKPSRRQSRNESRHQSRHDDRDRKKRSHKRSRSYEQRQRRYRR